MTDLTAITTPFGLLDAETQAALKAHGGPYEFANDDTLWEFKVPSGTPVWWRSTVYRVKPQPPKPREWWAVFMNGLHVGMWPDRKGAEGAATGYNTGAEIIHVREVLE